MFLIKCCIHVCGVLKKAINKDKKRLRFFLVLVSILEEITKYDQKKSLGNQSENIRPRKSCPINFWHCSIYTVCRPTKHHCLDEQTITCVCVGEKIVQIRVTHQFSRVIFGNLDESVGKELRSGVNMFELLRVCVLSISFINRHLNQTLGQTPGSRDSL